jgi:hypothetical protein
MSIELSYKWSDLDKKHCFGLDFTNLPFGETYIRWVWYHLGQLMIAKKQNVLILPYKPGNSKVYKNYKYCNDARRQAALLANAINKKTSS